MDLILMPIRAAWWVASTVVLGARWLVRTILFAVRLPRLFSETATCPRGHRVPLYGVYQCASCHAVHEGYVFGRCAVCGERAGWTSCPTCQLPVRSPLR